MNMKASRNIFWVITLWIILPWTSHAQKYILVELSSDSITVGTVITVKYSLVNFQGQFEAPDFSDFQLQGGPSVSTQMQFVNGDMSSSQSYSYRIQARDQGLYYIGPAYIISDGQTWESAPIAIDVYSDNLTAIKNSRSLMEVEKIFIDKDSPTSTKKPVKKSLARKKKKIRL